MNFKALLTIAATAAMGVSLAHAGVKAGSEEAKALLERAAAHIEHDGQAKALRDFNDPKAGFVKGSLYVFALDLDGKYLASGANPRLAGNVVRDTTDAAGHPLFRDMIGLAKEKGEGQVDYVWLNRVTNKVETKHSFIRRVGELVLGVGYYD